MKKYLSLLVLLLTLPKIAFACGGVLLNFDGTIIYLAGFIMAWIYFLASHRTKVINDKWNIRQIVSFSLICLISFSVFLSFSISELKEINELYQGQSPSFILNYEFFPALFIVLSLALLILLTTYYFKRREIIYISILILTLLVSVLFVYSQITVGWPLLCNVPVSF